MAGLCATDNESHGGLAAAAVPLCLLHDQVGVAAFLASHPLHAAYLVFFARQLVALAAFFCPLLFSTVLLLSVLATVGPYLGGRHWLQQGGGSLGRTCGIAVAALCAELQPDDAGGAGLVAQLCSFVLYPTGDAAAVQRLGEIVGELCDITSSSFLSDEEQKSLVLQGGDNKEECKELLPPPFMVLDHHGSGEYFKDEIDDKVVISEDLKYLDEQSEARSVVVQDREKAEEEEVVIIQDQGLISSEMDDTIITEKRLECDPVSVEISCKCQPVQAAMEMEVKNCEPAQAMQVRPRSSSIAQRIKLWEAQVSGNFKTVTEDKEDISVKFSFESEPNPCVETRDRNLNNAQDITSSTKQSVEGQAEFKDVKECVTETLSAMHSPDLQAEEHVLSEAECHQAEECKAEQDLPHQQQQEEEEYKDITESPVRCNGREESSLKLSSTTSIVGRVHSRTTSENLISEVSPKEWKRTLACKLYEERMQLKLCRDRAVVEGSDNMDMLWEAYEVGGNKLKHSNKVEECESELDDDDDEGSVRQLCCLQALKFSTKKMSFGGGKPSLAKMSKVLKRMAVLSRMGSRRSHKD